MKCKYCKIEITEINKDILYREGIRRESKTQCKFCRRTKNNKTSALRIKNMTPEQTIERKAKQLEYYYANRDKVAKKSKECLEIRKTRDYSSYIEKQRAKFNRWRIKHYDKYLANATAMHHNRRSAGPRLKLRDIQEIKQIYNKICVYCGKLGNSIDHIVPISKGGTNDKNNLTLACRTCNSRKHNMSLLEFLQYNAVIGVK